MHADDNAALRTFRRAYAIALACVAVTLLASSLLMHSAITQHADVARVINLSGRQRMLSQRIAKSVLALERATDPAALRLRRVELAESVETWKAVHLGLQQGNETLGFPAPDNSRETRAMFAELAPVYARMVEALDWVVSQPLNATLDAARLRTTADILLENEPAVLALLDRITFQLDAEASARISSTQQAELLVLFVGLVVLALEALFIFRPSFALLARFMDNLRAANERLRESNEQLAQSLENARQMAAAARHENIRLEENQRQLAFALHEGAAQSVVAADLHLWELQRNAAPTQQPRYQALRELMKQAVEDLRTLSYGVRPATLSHFGLYVALRELAQLHSTASCSVALVGSPAGAESLSETIRVGLFRIAESALANVAQHSQARTATIELSVDPREVRLEIRQDGVGFDADALTAEGRIGLVALRERAGWLGGTCAVRSSPNGESSIVVTVPLGSASASEPPPQS